MTARTWTATDPEPTGNDVPWAVVDRDDVTWLWDVDLDDEDGTYPYVWRQLACTRHEAGGVTGGLVCVEWWQLVGEYGPLREATAAEAGNYTVRFETTNAGDLV